MKMIVTFGRKKFVCELKKIRVKGKQEKYIEKVFCREVKSKKSKLKSSSKKSKGKKIKTAPTAEVIADAKAKIQENQTDLI